MCRCFRKLGKQTDHWMNTMYHRTLQSLGQHALSPIVWESYVLASATLLPLLLLSRFSHVWLSATPQTAAHQAPLSLGFSRQEQWSGLPFPLPIACMHAKSLQLYPVFCHPLDCSPPSSSVPGILQARILEWVAMPSCRGSSQPRDQTHVS